MKFKKELEGMESPDDVQDSRGGLLAENGGTGRGDKPCPPPPATFKYKVLKSFIVSNTFTFMGLATAIVTPSIDDLRRQVGCDYEQFARAFIFGSVGGMVGGLIGGTLADRFQKHIDLLMGLELIIAALARAALPWAPNVEVMAALFCVTGLMMGASNPTSNAHLLVIWGAQASSPMQLLHMGYGVGTVVSPLIVEPFLAHTNSSAHAHNSTLSLGSFLSADPLLGGPILGGLQDLDSPQTGNVTSESRIYIPYAVIGAHGVLSGILFLLFYLMPTDMARGQRLRVKERKTMGQLFNPGECADGRALYGITMIALIFLLYVMNSGKDCSVNVFMYAVAVDTALGFSTLQGSLLATGYYAGYAGGRAVYSILGIFIPVQLLLLSEIVGMLAVHTTLALIGLDSQLNFWICVCLSGFFAGPLVPTTMTWMDRYIEMTSLAFASLSIGLALGGFLFNWIAGYIFQHKQPVDLYYMSLGCGVAVTLIVIVGQVLGSLHGDRYEKMKREESETRQIGEGEESGDENGFVEYGDPNVSDTDHLIQ